MGNPSNRMVNQVVGRFTPFRHRASVDSDSPTGPTKPTKPTESTLLTKLAKLAIAALLIATWFTLLAPRNIGGPVSMIWVSGTSMEPTLFNGDLAVLYQADGYKVGDIVAFEIPEGGTVIHRVIRVTPTGYEFQGDNRDWQDPWDLDESWIRGRQIFSVPQAAQAMSWLGQPVAMALLVAALVVVAQLRASSSPTARAESRASRA